MANFLIRPGTKVVDDTILLCILVWLTTCKNEGQGDVSKFVEKCQKYGFVGTVAKVCNYVKTLEHLSDL